MQSVSDHARSDAFGRGRILLDSNRTLALSRPVVAWSASGHVVARAVLCDRRVRSWHLTVGAQ
jgi:hypothetical protein